MSKNVITLITNPINQLLDSNIINITAATIEEHKGKVDEITWLASDEALDVKFSEVDSSTIRIALETNLADYRVDSIVQHEAGRKKKLLISDMDSTIINQECIDEIAAKLNLKDQVARITELAMNGEIEFKQALRQRVALLEGLNVADLQDVYDNHISLMSGAKTLVKTMKQNKATAILVSGGFTFFTEKVAKSCSFDENHANILETQNETLTGTVSEPILDKDSKSQILEDSIKKLSLNNDETIAVGDGANDIPMLLKAGLGVAYRAKQNVQKHVKHKINHGDLTALLFMQGYLKSEFVVL